MEDLIQNLVLVVASILGIVSTYVVSQVKGYFDKKGITDELKKKQAYADIVVNAAQQMFKEANGAEKFETAKINLVAMLNEQGVPFTEKELDLLIESSVKGMKDGISGESK